MGKHGKKRQQQQSGSTHGRPVLVTFYVTRPRRKDGGIVSTATASSRNVHRHHHDVHHHHHHHHHHHLRGGSSDEVRRGTENPRSYDRRLDLLEYSRQLRATAATPPPHPKPAPPRHSTKTTVGYGDQVVPQPKPPAPAADGRRQLVRRRLERASSQHISQSCLGGNWSWKRVLTLVLPCHSSSSTHQSSTGTRSRTNRRDDKDGKDNSSKAKSWPAAVELVSKLKVDRRRSRSRRSSTDDNGLVKKFFSMFRQQSRSTR